MKHRDSTRQRLITAASQLFADNGYRGASVRDICNLAGANAGAVSYHFGSKHQLYRTVLRNAAERLADAATTAPPPAPPSIEVCLATVHRIFRALQEDPGPARLLIRDLADGGTVAVEALSPKLRATVAAISDIAGHGETPHGRAAARLLFLQLAAPLVLLTAAWPVVERALDLDAHRREGLLLDLLGRVHTQPERMDEIRERIE